MNKSKRLITAIRAGQKQGCSVVEFEGKPRTIQSLEEELQIEQKHLEDLLGEESYRLAIPKRE